ncbi:DUF2911 domain-containing protein [Flavobacteriaceae bacterium]|nr:DUF2911 domain-containing protein [Flavobacteriaceae bacterium]MDA8758422.1 DUF2911 domain-containing protein [Flavobacteriaceae bacterium]MDA8763570.1 DUF2911 domain-containing protein [Flavobacteriaceae bacterium]
MKKLLILVLVATATMTQAQNFKGLDKSPMDRVFYPTSNRETDKAIVITYSRPQLKGRNLEDLVPTYEIWRTGANEATEVRLYKSIKLGDTVIKAGTYTMYSFPKDESTEIIINSATNVWGAYGYDKSKDVARIDLPVSESTEYLEAFSFAFSGEGNNAVLHGGWGNVRVEIPITIL